MRLKRNVLVWCCFWLLLTPLLAAPRAAVWTNAAPSIVAGSSPFDGAVRRHPAEILARAAARDDAGGDGASDGKALAAADFFQRDSRPASANALRPRAHSSLSGFLTRRTAHPRAPPA